MLNLQSWPLLLGGDLDWDFELEPQEGRNSDIRGSRAKVLGGCSSHNTGIAYPATDADLRAWAGLAPGWGPDETRPYYDRVAEKVAIEEAPQCEASGAFIAAAERLGFARFQSLGNAGDVGVGPTTINAIWPQRQSATVAYLHPLDSVPKNLTIVPDTHVDRILLDGNRAIGAETGAGTLLATREVIVCGGVFGSAQMLMLSGIGPAAHLQEMGIPVVADLPVGEHLIDHPEGILTYSLTRPIQRDRSMWVDAVLLADSKIGDAGEPDMMLWFFSGDFGDITIHGGQDAMETRRFSLAPDVTHPRSEGWMRLRSRTPCDPPSIQYNYFSDAEGYDETVMLEALQLGRRVVAEEPLSGWVDYEVEPGEKVATDSELIEYLRSSTYTAHHPAGTCRMAERGGVVDSQLRVDSIEGLRVADASVFPRMIGVNLCITAMMVGERCADLVRADKDKLPPRQFREEMYR